MSEHSHEILVTQIHPSGAEEWLCPSCGRQFIVQWMPEYQCIVLSQGDETAIHNMIQGAQIVANHQHQISEERLIPWQEWLHGIDLPRQLGEESSMN